MKTRTLTSLKILAAILLFGFTIISCGRDSDNEETPTSGYPKNVTIEYKLTGTGITNGSVLFAYTNESGGTSSLTDQNVPISKTVSRTVNQYDGIGLGFSAAGNGTVKAEILVNGTVMKTQNFTSSSVFSGNLVYIFP